MEIVFLSKGGIMSAPSLRLFLSTVTSEFGPHRTLLKAVLVGPRLDVKEQNDFINLGKDTLAMLDEYTETCTGVIHLLGEATGAWPAPENVQALLDRRVGFTDRVPILKDVLSNGTPLSYTQWEAYLALYHRKHLFLFQPAT